MSRWFWLLALPVAAEPVYQRPFQVTQVAPAPIYSLPGSQAVISGAELALAHEDQLEIHSSLSSQLLSSQKLPSR